MTVTIANDTVVVVSATDKAPSQLRIPAASPLQALYEHAACHPLLQRTLSESLSWQQRVGITIAQALRSSTVAPAWIAALLAADARVVYGENGEEQAALSELLPGRGLHGRHLQALYAPLDADRVRWGEAHVARMPGDRPIITAVATVADGDGVVRRARLALSGVWHESARLAEAADLLLDHPLDAEHIEEVARAIETEVGPAGDFLASAAYRRAMAVILTRRVLHQCQTIEEGESNR